MPGIAFDRSNSRWIVSISPQCGCIGKLQKATRTLSALSPMLMSRLLSPSIAVALCLSFLTACATSNERSPYSVVELMTATVEGYDSLRFFPDRAPDLQSALGWTAAQGGKPPISADGRFDVLVLSAGGSDGAYGAGALKGMTQARERADYEIVTGVSTGSLIAPFAFVGPRMDDSLEELYATGILGKALGRPSVFTAVNGSSLYPARRVPRFMERYVNEELMQQIAAEHAKGRRLLVATANLDANQLTIWDMGRIATAGGEENLELFRNVLRGAIAIPGALPPAEIETNTGNRTITELHGDAGVLSYFYFNTDLIPPQYRGTAALEVKPRVDIVLHNQFQSEAAPVEAKALTLAGVSVKTLTRTSMKLLLDDAIADTTREQIALRYSFLPQDWQDNSSLAFDEDYMRKTFDLGYQRAVDRRFWQQGQPDR